MRFILKVFRRIYRYYVPYSPLKRYLEKGLVIGKDSVLMEEVVIDVSHIWLIEIGNNVLIAPRARILAHDASTKIFLDWVRIGKVKIGDRVFIGADSIILPGVTIGDDVVVGAGSVVTKDVPSGSVVAGNPARLVSSLDNFLEKNRELVRVSHCFGKEYTVSGNVSDDLKKEMNDRLGSEIGYVK